VRREVASVIDRVARGTEELRPGIRLCAAHRREHQREAHEKLEAEVHGVECRLAAKGITSSAQAEPRPLFTNRGRVRGGREGNSLLNLLEPRPCPGIMRPCRRNQLASRRRFGWQV